jgi:hypothetical protein
MTTLALNAASADILALDTNQSKKYLQQRHRDSIKLSEEVKNTGGKLGYCELKLHESNKGILVNGEWCENIFCALAYILAKWW